MCKGRSYPQEIVQEEIRKLQEKESQTEHCVVCGKDTNIPKTMDISYRNFYVEGAGQLCSGCYTKVYGE